MDHTWVNTRQDTSKVCFWFAQVLIYCSCYREEGGKICYCYSRPKKAFGKCIFYGLQEFPFFTFYSWVIFANPYTQKETCWFGGMHTISFLMSGNVMMPQFPVPTLSRSVVEQKLSLVSVLRWPCDVHKLWLSGSFLNATYMNLCVWRWLSQLSEQILLILNVKSIPLALLRQLFSPVCSGSRNRWTPQKSCSCWLHNLWALGPYGTRGRYKRQRSRKGIPLLQSGSWKCSANAGQPQT